MTADELAAEAHQVAQHAVPLTILTGFLGAGKTTLLNRLLTGDHGRRIAVLVNDFGSVNIDAELVIGVEDNMMSLANGCVCCEIRDDLIESVQGLVTMETPPEHILLEASGVADPAGIWATFAGSQHPEWVDLDGVICVVDTDQIFAHLDEAPDLLMLRARQIGFADLVILNKVDLAGPEMLAWVRNWINTMMDKVRLVETAHCEVPLDVLFGAGRAMGPRSTEVTAPPHEHGTRFHTWTYETERALDRAALREMIRTKLPGSVYRCKGFVRLSDEPGLALLQAVGRRSDLTAAPPSTTGSTRVVAIGTAGLDEDHLRQLFDGCLAD